MSHGWLKVARASSIFQLQNLQESLLKAAVVIYLCYSVLNNSVLQQSVSVIHVSSSPAHAVKENMFWYLSPFIQSRQNSPYSEIILFCQKTDRVGEAEVEILIMLCLYLGQQRGATCYNTFSSLPSNILWENSLEKCEVR